jgi:hypothetical protein
MQIEYSFRVDCGCPIDSLPDFYDITLLTTKTIPVEKILEVVERFSSEYLFQEDLTLQLQRLFNCNVTSLGTHSGVVTKVVA